jgi:transposase InsO family protein
MGQHLRGRLGPAGRIELVRLMRDEGMSERQAAACLSVAPATAHHWSVRERDAGDAERASGSWALDRSSRPHTSPRRTAAEVERRVCEVRRHTGWGPRLIAGVVGLPHSTVHRVLCRHGCSRPEPAERPAANRYEWPCPGDLLHIDVKSYARFERPGHAVTGDRQRHGARLTKPKLGYDYAHAAVDDHSRLAFAELFDDERAASVVAFIEHALAYYRRHGIRTRRILTDNHWSYTKNRELAALLERHGIEHWTIQPYRARTNGKVERFHQTMAREWGYGLSYRSSKHRTAALPHWIAYYNERRPHSALGGRPPITRAHNLPGQDS